uniref:Uncharacterized protein n=1 Tax=Oryza rufipogon TaxID=4529 RepID=A0A0E0QZF3_ORYRU
MFEGASSIILGWLAGAQQLLLSCSAALVIVVVVIGVVAIVVVGQLEQKGQRSYDQQRTST